MTIWRYRNAGKVRHILDHPDKIEAVCGRDVLIFLGEKWLEDEKTLRELRPCLLCLKLKRLDPKDEEILAQTQ